MTSRSVDAVSNRQPHKIPRSWQNSTLELTSYQAYPSPPHMFSRPTSRLLHLQRFVPKPSSLLHLNRSPVSQFPRSLSLARTISIKHSRYPSRKHYSSINTAMAPQLQGYFDQYVLYTAWHIITTGSETGFPGIEYANFTVGWT